jgi:deoxyadenosine/deoxycytidine kinase
MLITIEGNIGSGKTTLLKQLQNVKFFTTHTIVFENVELWSSIKDSETNLFELYYTNKSRWSFVFQVFVLVSRLYDMTVASKKSQIVICERCHLTDLKVFTELLYSEKNLTDVEYSVYKQMHSMVQDMLNISIDIMIYIKCDPKVCLNRIKRRARDGEQNISLEYLQMLHNKHGDYIKEFSSTDPILSNASKLECNTLVLDGTYEDDSIERQKQIEEIIEFVRVRSTADEM